MTNVPDRDYPRNDYSIDSSRAPKASGTSMLWVVVVIAAALIVAVGWYGYRHNTSVPALSNDAATQQAAPVAAPPAAPAPAPSQSPAPAPQ